MQARKFRILFHNTEQGIFCTSSLYDEENEQGFTYIYTGGSRETLVETSFDKIYFNQLGNIDLLVLADFSISQIRKALAVIKYAAARVVVYPYTPPVQRRIILQEAIAAGEEDEDLLNFIKDPYRYLKRRQIIFVYPLLGNGPVFDGKDNGSCHNFELADDDVRKCVTSLEGYEQPIVHAGYILENHWLMFLGSYGLDLMAVKAFCDEMEQDQEDLDYLNVQSQIQRERRLTTAYLAKFGKEGFGTVVMYSSPVNGGPSEDDSMLMVKTFGNMRRCQPVLTPESEMCSALCMYKDDHDECKRHNQSTMTNHIHGVMFLGSLDLKKHACEFMERFSVIADSVRFFTLPDDGRLEHWDKRILSWGPKGHRKYWIGSSQAHPQVVKDIVVTDSYVRYMTLNNTCGVCVFGFLAKLTKDRFDKKSNEHKI